MAVEWQAAVGLYPHTRALRSGAVSSDQLRLVFADLPTINRAFAPMVREARFDVSEMAIATFLQAKAYGKPLVLLPVTVAARFQQSALLCRIGSDIRGPADLAGRRVGVRAYSQTTGMWLRGILADEYGIEAASIRWVTFEGAHVSEYQDPPWAERAPPAKDLLGMLRADELDAVIVGNEVPDDPHLRPVFSDVATSAQRFWDLHRFVPVNHLITVRRQHAESRPDLIAELVRMFRAAKELAGPQREPDPYLIGRDALQPVIALALRYAVEQGLLPMTVDDVWAGLPSGCEEAAQ
jgi:4,5-dihydroxyphthalate decarboxylase